MIDKAVSRTLFLRAWSLLSGFFFVVVVPVFLNPHEQGFYFTFSSILAIQIFFELGLSQVLVYRFSDFYHKAKQGHEHIALTHQKLLYVARLVYRLLAICFFIVASLGGYLFLSSRPNIQVSWQFQWLILVLLTSINLIQSVKLSYIEAAGEMASVSVARLKANFLGTILFFLVLIFGGKLWATCALPLVNVISLTIWIYRHSASSHYREQRFIGKCPIPELSSLWAREIFPMQWRISLSWISGYFVFQLFTPIAFSRFGPVIAGRLGFVISIMSSLLFVATTFTSALSPKLAMLYSGHKIKLFNSTFDKSFKQSLVALIFFTQSASMAILLLSVYHSSLGHRLLDPLNVWIYSFTTLLTGVLYCLSIYLRSQQKEPLLLQSLVTSGVMIPVMFYSSLVSLTCMLMASLAVTLFSTIWAAMIYIHNRKNIISVCIS